LRSSQNGAWTPGLWLVEAASNSGAKGRDPPGQALPPGPEVREKNWLEVWLPRAVSQGAKELVTGNVPHAVGVASNPRSEPKKCILNAVRGFSGRSAKRIVSCPVAGSASTLPGILRWNPKPSATRKIR
jgi:hypothetical protein